MEKETRPLLFSLLNNIVVMLIKIIGGLVFHCSSLLADGFHTLSDLSTDIIALVGSKISNKRANKKHPFGYGMVDYIVNLIIGAEILFLGLFIIVDSFSSTTTLLSPIIIVIVIITLIMKLFAAFYLFKKGQQIQSPILATSAKESFIDVYSSIGVLIIVLLAQLNPYIAVFKYADKVGSILIGLLIIKTSISLLKDNVIALLGENTNNEELINKLKEIIEKNPQLKAKKINLIMNGSYYQAHILLDVSPNMSVRNLIKLEYNLKQKIKRSRLKIKYIDIDII